MCGWYEHFKFLVIQKEPQHLRRFSLRFENSDKKLDATNKYCHFLVLLQGSINFWECSEIRLKYIKLFEKRTVCFKGVVLELSIHSDIGLPSKIRQFYSTIKHLLYYIAESIYQTLARNKARAVTMAYCITYLKGESCSKRAARNKVHSCI